MRSPSQPVLPPINSPPPLHIPALTTPAPSPDISKDSPRPPRQAHSNVLARLQSLFPSAPHAQPNPPSDPPPPPPPKPLPPFIKVRILTWNMHDSLPKGDLEELLGSVSPSNPSFPSSLDVPTTLPVFPPSPDHPYHLVIVAGQECPSASGIPMALGAGFKLNNKDNSRSRHSLLGPQDADEPVHRKSIEADLLSPAAEKNYEHHHPPSSWSSLLENWYCCPPTTGPPSTPTSDPSSRSLHELERIGPYELLIKERLMGLYLAVFIHREVRPFVLGTSKSVVTTGLIGGRVGNKGAVGASVNLCGTTLLFINAHLAAHESKVHHRLADLAKIKAELTVDDFLSPDDPRFMSEDITDRFDSTFIFGDLNFRLDITRLHADWLISRKEYEQAFEFDQLRKVMASGEAFNGFQEAPIRFPPTFKYDVLRTIGKRSRHRSFKHPPATPTIIMSPHEKLLSEVAEHSQETSAAMEHQQERSLREPTCDDDADPDAASVTSSAYTSVRSRHTVDPEDETDTEREPGSARLINQSPPASAGAHHLVHRWSTSAAHKAKEKWVTLFSANGPQSPSVHSSKSKKSKWRQSWASAKSQTPSRRPNQPVLEDMQPQTPADTADLKQLKVGRAKEFQAPVLDTGNAREHEQLAQGDFDVNMGEEDKGVYDSSHKQRVPSWCDRILWKSTIVQEPEIDTADADSQRFMPLRAKMGQIFNALRPSSIRSRRDSTWSMQHPELSQQGNPASDHLPHIVLQPAPPRRSTTAAPTAFSSRTKPPLLRRLSQTRSADSLRGSPSEERTLTRVHSLEPPSPQAGPGRGVPMRHANTISPVMPVGDASPTLVSSPVEPEPEPASPLDMTPIELVSASPSSPTPVFKWLLPFLYRDGAQQQVAPPQDPLATVTLSPQPPPPRRGDVVCLKYDTLDDKGMRRLEGRSDHRPVIGSYALYI